MPVTALLQAAPYIKQGWNLLPPSVKEGIIRGGIAKGTQWFGNRLFGGTPETDEYQKRLQDQMRLIQDQIRRPGATPVGQAIQRTIKQQSKQAQQSLAASAAQRGQTGASPARASQMQELERRAQQQAAAMAQLSASGQQQYNQLLGAQGRLAEEERSALSEIMGFIMKGAAEAGTKKLLSEILQDAWEAPPETMGTPAATQWQEPVIPTPVQGGYMQPAPQAPTLNVPARQLPLPEGAPLPTPAPVRQPGVTYPSELIQRAPMTRQQPGYQPPVYENIPQQEEYAQQIVEQLRTPPVEQVLPAPEGEAIPPPEEATSRQPRTVRTNNPGAIEYGEFAKQHGATGTDGRFAVFPDEATGVKALKALLKTNSYKNLTLDDAFRRYAPAPENNPVTYVDNIVRITGIDRSKKISELTEQEFNALVYAVQLIHYIKTIEGG